MLCYKSGESIRTAACYKNSNDDNNSNNNDEFDNNEDKVYLPLRR